MKTLKITHVACALAGALLLTSACSSEVSAQERNAEGYLVPFSKGGRFGLGVGQTRILTTDSEGRTTERTGINGSILLGVGFAVHERVALDLDAGLRLAITPEAEVDQFSLTPGVRLFAIPELYGRLALLNYFLEPSNTLFLTGVGYYLRASRVSLFAEVSYVAWSREEVDFAIIPRFGIEAAF